MTDQVQERRANRAPHSLSAAEIQQIVGQRIENAADFTRISGVSTVDVTGHECLIFRDRFNEGDLAAIDAFAGKSALFLLPTQYRGAVRVPAIFLEHPREAFIALTARIYDYFDSYWTGFEDFQDARARHSGAVLMPGCFVHPSAHIGPGSMIFPGVVVGPGAILGRNVIVKSNTVIGLPGFGIYVDDDKRNYHLPHVGGVIIGDDVELGALNTVCAGTIHATIVEDNVKCDDHVHIAHNVVVGRSTQITAHVEISGSVVIGPRCFLGPNCSIANSATIGSDSIIGIGSAVLKDVPDNKLAVGNPSRVLRDLTGVTTGSEL